MTEGISVIRFFDAGSLTGSLPSSREAGSSTALMKLSSDDAKCEVSGSGTSYEKKSIKLNSIFKMKRTHLKCCTTHLLKQSTFLTKYCLNMIELSDRFRFGFHCFRHFLEVRMHPGCY